MAIIKDFSKNIPGVSQPVIIKDAYWRVTEIKGSKEELNITVEVKESADSDGTIGMLATHFKPDPQGANYHAQAYEHLKSLDLFSGAKDG